MRRRFWQLKLEEREQIMALRSQGKSLREIAKEMERDHTTISREVRRNDRAKRYWACIAQRDAEKRKRKAGRRDRLKKEAVRNYVHAKLVSGWSPEQIEGRISQDQPGSSIGHEAIYQYVYCDAKELIPFLPRRHRRRRQRGMRKPRVSPIPNRINITERPEEVNQRHVFGHWEADAMVSRQSKQALNVLVERMSRYVKLTKLSDMKASSTRESLVRRLRYERKRSRLSITYDNGFENRDHELINQKLKTKSYFCNPYHSWEKRTVENTAGLVRRLIPMRTDFARIPNASIKQIENSINNRPRKCLQYQTPKEVYQTLSGVLPG